MNPSRARLGDPAEDTVWSGRRISLAGSVAGHRLPSARYRVTTSWVHWTAGRPGAKPERVALWAVRDADVRQSIAQRARRVGDIVLSLQHHDYTQTPTFVVFQDVERPRDAARMINAAAREARQVHDAHRPDVG
jgi:hypothetical protein